MNVSKFLTDDRAVSPVVGVALLIAIAVILAAAIGGVVLGIGVGPANDAPSASLEFDHNDSDLIITHAGGDTLNFADDEVEIRGDINDSATVDENLAAGETITVDNESDNIDDGDEFSVVYVGGDDETVIGKYEA